MTREAIILCGGYGQRLKPYIDVSKPLLELKPNLTLQFGRVQIDNNLITGFEQKPFLDFYVSARAGHYTFKTEVIRKHFPLTRETSKTRPAPNLPHKKCSNHTISTEYG